jgi:hypothetical protein
MQPPSLPGRQAPFFLPDINNATGESSATGEQNPSVDENTPEEEIATVAKLATVHQNRIDNDGPVIEDAGENIVATVVENASGVIMSTDEQKSTVANSATGVMGPVVAENAAAAKIGRSSKLRPLRRITDGLTPGQYAVYSLMLENSEAGEGGERLYRGGYADIGRLTGLSKRGIQNVIGDLQEKAVIRLHTAPGHHRFQTSAYIVPKPESVLSTWLGRGWRFATGKSKRLTNGAPVALFSTGDAA